MRFDAHDWPVRGFHSDGEGPLAAALEQDPGARVYEVEVRLSGAAKWCDRGAEPGEDPGEPDMAEAGRVGDGTLCSGWRAVRLAT